MVRHALILGFASLLLGAAGAAPAGATAQAWFSGAGGDELWTNPANWVLEDGQPGVPTVDHALYISTSDVFPEIGDALIDDSMSILHRTLYIGGWHPQDDAVHGDPHGRLGVLNMTGGSLIAAPSDVGVPCSYIRLGYRAHGVLNQSGGSVESCTVFTLGMGSPEAFGTWNVSGGSLDSYGWNIGVHGTGVVDMTGGTISGTHGKVGRGYGYEDRYLPGVGLLQQSGGSIEFGMVPVGEHYGSAGILAVRNDASFTTGGLRVGAEGVGAVVQTGGTLSARGHIDLGYALGSSGALTISGGVLEQVIDGYAGQRARGLYVGHEGHGQLNIVGSEAEISIAGVYRQGPGSMLSMRLGAEPPHVTPIVVGAGTFHTDHTATFEPASLLYVTFDPEEFTPAPGQHFHVLEAAGGIVGLPQLVGATDFGVSVTTVGGVDVLRVTYLDGLPGNECNDGLDNDGDGAIDLEDPGCVFPNGPTESPQCDDGVDNDGDDAVDLADSNCTASWWDDETTSWTCGLLGFEVLPLLGWSLWRRRAGRA